MRLLLLPAAILAVWLLICAWYYFQQESVIFHPSSLPAAHEFEFDRPFEEHRIEVEPGLELSALLFPAADAPARPAGKTARSAASDSTTTASGRGVVLYLHGNAGDLQSWGWHAGLYVEAGHDFLVVDYRGYGKSDGRIESEEQLHADVGTVWRWLAERYDPRRITVVGYSLGAPLAARIACHVDPSPEHLVLMAPFVSAEDLAKRMVPFVPTTLLRYPLRTDRYLEECELPVTIFHGQDDRTIPIIQGRRLAELFGDRARLITLPATGHQDIAAHPVFQREMTALLSNSNPFPENGSDELRD